jgi:hypothetical protein
MRIVRLALFVMTMSMLGTEFATAQVDLTKALVGKWEGEIEQRTVRTANPGLILVITSVREEGGRWIADGRAGTRTGRPAPVKIDIDASGKQPSLRWTEGTGNIYNVYLVDEKNLVGTATLTMGTLPKGPRDRSVKLEKME